MNRSRRALVAALVLVLAAACGGGQEAGEPGGEQDPAPAATAGTETQDAGEATATDGEATAGEATATEGEATDGDAAAAGCDPLPTYAEGKLTVATGEPVFEPWMVDDDPSNGQGFESALVYALADELGVDAADVEWVRTGFDEAIAPGEKPYDFNIQQYSINPERAEVVGFSIGYYEVEQAIIAPEGNPVADARSLDDLASARLGAAIGTTSLDYIEDVIQPETQAQVYNDNAAAKAAFDAGQVDGIVLDLPTAYYVTAVEIPEASIVGVLPRVEGGEPEELGLLFEKDAPLIDCVDPALQALHDDGTIAALEDEWLAQGGDIPTLEQ